ncbi:MAG: DNA polymerase ligase N-terminal domain-containing protein [Spirochaetota bacterium]
MARRNSLKEYRKKRDFSRTTEPQGGSQGPSGKPIFLVQKHRARNLHYDFRLEVQGVLKSWAVPKGPSLNPKEKRLAIMTEDHPMEYADYEGVIPEGEYGAGTVILWDRGTYRDLKKQEEGTGMEELVEAGRGTVWLEGEKLRGGFSLVRTRRGKGNQWLLIKKEDEHADSAGDILEDRPKSVLTGRTIEEVSTEPPTQPPCKAS